MNGMIFAAGLGTRLRPLTDDRPKALVELHGEPLLMHVLRKMHAAGIRRVVVNIHHFADQVEGFLYGCTFPGMEILVSDERDMLLDTGGGLLKARALFLPGEPVLIHNVDICTDLDLGLLLKQHLERKAYATLAVRPGGKGRVLRFDAEGVLKGWENLNTGEQKVVDPAFYLSRPCAFCGIQVLSAGYLQQMVHTGCFSIIDEHLQQARRNRLEAYYHDGICLDLGTPDSLKEASAMVAGGL